MPWLLFDIHDGPGHQSHIKHYKWFDKASKANVEDYIEYDIEHELSRELYDPIFKRRYVRKPDKKYLDRMIASKESIARDAIEQIAFLRKFQ